MYTDPLFVFLQIAGTWISGDVYWATRDSLAPAHRGRLLPAMYPQTASAMVVGTAILLSSKAFMDFSVSGLENPATHFGIAAFCWAYWRNQSALVLTLIASFTAVNRLDSFLLAWEMFSIFYYGFPFPNTAYAKLNTGVSSGELIRQGVAYLSNDYHWDKLTAIVIVGGIVLGLWKTDWPLALGVLASVLYVVRVGGDFMSGRFLSPALFLACGLIIHRTRLRWTATLGITTAILVLGLRNPRPTLTTTSNFGVGLPHTDVSRDCG
jgi:arabinofuranosyltransferase